MNAMNNTAVAEMLAPILLPDSIKKILSPIAKQAAGEVVLEVDAALAERELPEDDPVKNVVLAMVAGHLMRALAQTYDNPALRMAAALAFNDAADPDSLSAKATDDIAEEALNAAIARAA